MLFSFRVGSFHFEVRHTVILGADGLEVNLSDQHSLAHHDCLKGIQELMSLCKHKQSCSEDFALQLRLKTFPEASASKVL